jgi:hypothetical protein
VCLALMGLTSDGLGCVRLQRGAAPLVQVSYVPGTLRYTHCTWYLVQVREVPVPVTLVYTVAAPR